MRATISETRRTRGKGATRGKEPGEYGRTTAAGRNAPLKIVSLLPSATEIVCCLGLEDRLVGVTHECDYPRSIIGLPKVTKTLVPSDAGSGEIDRLVRKRLQTSQALYTLDLPVLEALRPDLIVTQALCDVCAVAEEEVRAAACDLPGSPRVVNLEPETLGEVLGSVRQVAQAAGVKRMGEEVVRRLEARVDAVASESERVAGRPRVVLLEWLDPPFSCGHWSPELVRLAGGDEGLGREGVASRTLTWDEVIAWQPEVVLIACCGFSVERTMEDVWSLGAVPGWNDLPAVRAERVYVTDGAAYFSRPGPRLVDSLEILAHTLHPTHFLLPPGLPEPIRVSEVARAERDG